MKSKAFPIAILCADLHLTLQQPACRADTDWMEVQARYLKQLKEKARHGTRAQVPVLCAGDIFDKWNPAPELITFALENLPEGMICVPGQHDLPNHRMDGMYRSGYGVLKSAGHIHDVSGPDGYFRNSDLTVKGFGWDEEITPKIPESLGDEDLVNVAIIHRYCWAPDKSYPGAPEDSKFSAYKEKLKGYDVAVFGDNHQAFQSTSGKTVIHNCGGFIVRKSDEIGEAAPAAGVLLADGTVEWSRYDTELDIFHEIPKDRPEQDFDLKGFIDGLGDLGEHGLNFREVVEQHIAKEAISPSVKEIIARSLDSFK